jgi:tyrosyl-tRNA synthetase
MNEIVTPKQMYDYVKNLKHKDVMGNVHLITTAELKEIIKIAQEDVPFGVFRRVTNGK